MRKLIFKLTVAGLIVGMSSASVPALADTPEFEECIANCNDYADGDLALLNQCTNWCFVKYHPEAWQPNAY